MCTRYVYSDTLHLTWLFWGEFPEMLALILGGTCEKQTLDLANLGKKISTLEVLLV